MSKINVNININEVSKKKRSERNINPTDQCEQILSNHNRCKNKKIPGYKCCNIHAPKAQPKSTKDIKALSEKLCRWWNKNYTGHPDVLMVICEKLERIQDREKPEYLAKKILKWWGKFYSTPMNDDLLIMFNNYITA